MPATYCSLHFHAVLSTKDRYPSITSDWRNKLHAYLGGIVKNLGGVSKTNVSWQPGYFCVTVSPSHVERVKGYILNQEAHHQHKTFKDEYVEMLKLAGIEYDDRYVW